MTEVGRVALAARVFTVAMLTSLAAVAGQQYVAGALTVVVVATIATVLATWVALPEMTVALLEGSAIAVVVVATFPNQDNVTPYLAIPVLIGGLVRGREGVLRVTGLEFGVLLGLWLLTANGWNREVAASGFTWLATSIGLGAMGAVLGKAFTSGETEASYRSALALIRRLDALSGKLSGGLDAVDIAEQVMDDAALVVPTRRAGILVVGPHGEVVPLRYSFGTVAGSMSWAPALAEKCLTDRGPVLHDRQAALPMSADGEVVAVLVLDSMGTIDRSDAERLLPTLAPQALQLQAALLFGRVRDAATSQERMRIAREVHDGVAQDVASLGYLVDNLHTATEDPDQRSRIAQLRGELTRVVTELRHSIFDLRQVTPAGLGLGESLSTYARQVGSTSPLTVHVTLDEKGQRLQLDVEHELLRIAQEAMNNARKHSGAENLWLSCSVDAPYAEIEVLDDGSRAHEPRPDSHGMKIMHERAASIGADLDVCGPESTGVGTRVSVRLGAATR